MQPGMRWSAGQPGCTAGTEGGGTGGGADRQDRQGQVGTALASRAARSAMRRSQRPPPAAPDPRARTAPPPARGSRASSARLCPGRGSLPAARAPTARQSAGPRCCARPGGTPWGAPPQAGRLAGAAAASGTPARRRRCLDANPGALMQVAALKSKVADLDGVGRRVVAHRQHAAKRGIARRAHGLPYRHNRAGVLVLRHSDG